MTETYSPLEATVPPASDEILTDEQWKTLLSLTDTFIPTIRALEPGNNAISDKLVPAAQLNHAVSSLARRIRDDNPSVDSAAATHLAYRYYEENTSSNPAFKGSIQCVLANHLHDEGKRGVILILNLLKYVCIPLLDGVVFAVLIKYISTRPGSLVLTGSTTLIRDQPFDVREKVLRSWATSHLPPIRLAFRALSLIARKPWVGTSPTIGSVVGLPRVPINVKPAKGFDFSFVQLPPAAAEQAPEIVETDVVVVGSGCGGGVAAKNLAEAGNRVLVVDKSYHYPKEYFPMKLEEGTMNLFEGGASLISDDATMVLLAGSTWGGGGTVNWSAALQTQDFVRQEWSNAGLPFFTSSQFQEALDRVSERLGVNSEHVQHSRGNQVILEGARRLGYAAKTVPQNTGNAVHNCGHCTFGCMDAGKKGPAESYLIDAAQAGAMFMEGFCAERVLFEKGGGAVAGVIGTWTSRDAHLSTSGGGTKRKLVIKARRVIVACGSLQSPLLLLRSGLKNSQIGRNLFLHPGRFCIQSFPWLMLMIIVKS